MTITAYLSTITFNVNGLNAPIKRGRRDEKVFADEIKMTRLFWVVPMGPKCHRKCPYQRDAEGE